MSNRTNLTARAAVDAAGDALTVVYDALRSKSGPTLAQLVAFSQAATCRQTLRCTALTCRFRQISR